MHVGCELGGGNDFVRDALDQNYSFAMDTWHTPSCVPNHDASLMVLTFYDGVSTDTLTTKCIDHDILRKIRAACDLSYCTNSVKDRASSCARFNGELLDLIVNPRCRPPLKKYVLGSSSGVLIQVLNVHSFPNISNAHKNVQLSVAKTDGMRDVAA